MECVRKLLLVFLFFSPRARNEHQGDAEDALGAGQAIRIVKHRKKTHTFISKAICTKPPNLEFRKNLIVIPKTSRCIQTPVRRFAVNDLTPRSFQTHFLLTKGSWRRRTHFIFITQPVFHSHNTQKHKKGADSKLRETLAFQKLSWELTGTRWG